MIEKVRSASCVHARFLLVDTNRARDDSSDSYLYLARFLASPISESEQSLIPSSRARPTNVSSHWLPLFLLDKFRIYSLFALQSSETSFTVSETV